jgi:hypothetical protein
MTGIFERARPWPRADPRPGEVLSGSGLAETFAAGSSRAPVWRRFGPSRPILLLVALALALCAMVLTALLIATGGHFEYSLDDAYIHLRLSQMISAGTYGINAGQPASPSSSIAWPFLLAPFSGFRVHPYVPLVISIASLFGTFGVAFRGLLTTWEHSDPRGIRRIATLLAAGLLLNWFGLPFTGMEQSLHVLTAVACASGLLLFVYRGSTPWWFWAALIVGPLIRYEGIAVSAVTLVAVAALGKWRQALAIGLAAAIPIALFSVFLVQQGLPPLPDSVLAKWGPGDTHLSAGRLVRSALTNLSANFADRSPVVLLYAICLAATIALTIRAARQKERDRGTIPLLAATGVLFLHLVFGRNGWFGRYEIYALSYACLMLLAVFAPLLNTSFQRIGLMATLVVALILGETAAPMYLMATLQTPLAAQAIYDRQHQMHVFAVDYLQGPVAVNDLGEVSYNNPNEVVDLAGLGSDKALRARLSGDSHWLSALVNPARIPAAVIYTDWFGDAIPTSWVKVGTIVAQPGPSGGEAQVDVYATSQFSVPRVRRALAGFAGHLHSRTNVRLEKER